MLKATYFRSLKPAFYLFLLVCFNCLPVQGQDEVGEFVRTGIDNSHKLVKAYTNPLTKSFATDLNTGWLSSGEALKPGRFELRVFASAAFIPRKDQTFDVTQIGLSPQVQPANAAQTMAPTFFGDDNDGLPLRVFATRPDNGQQVQVAAFNSPPGIGWPIAPIPLAQLAVGLYKETEVMFRFIPQVRYSDNQVNLWGLGLKHNLGQWIPGINQLPVKLIASVAYTDFQTSEGVDIEPEPGVANPNPEDYNNQKITFETKAYSANLLLSRTFFKWLSAFGGVSYSKGISDAALTGNYPVTQLRQQPPFNKEIVNYTDPINLDYNHGELGLSGGLRFKFKIISFNLAGTWSDYSSVHAGIGLGWY